MEKRTYYTIVVKKYLFLFSCWLLTAPASFGQFVTCESLSLMHSQTPVVFTASFSASWGDSTLYIPITNNSGTNFGYPEARIIAITPLPTGMSFHASSTGWWSFGSSWNNGQTNSAEFYFYVSVAIPTDYLFSFRLQVRNFAPLAIDSCYFTDTITVNLNPGVLGIQYQSRSTQLRLIPNPASRTVTLYTGGRIAEITVFDFLGKKLLQQFNSEPLQVSSLPDGIYYCHITMENGERIIQKLVVSK